MDKKTYWEKLKDPRWQKLRLEVMEKNEFRCEVCFDSESPLNVHHKEYFKGNEPWEYELNQLAVLCETCHEAHHNSFNTLKWICSLAPLDGPCSRDEISFLIAGFMSVPYDGIISISGLPDVKFRRKLYSLGVKARNSKHA